MICTRMMFIVLYIVSIIIGNTTIKFLVLPTLYVLFLRYLFSVIIFFPFTRLVFDKVLIVKSFTQLVAIISTYAGYRAISLNSATLVAQTLPLISYLILMIIGRSSFEIRKLLGIILGYLGVIVAFGLDIFKTGGIYIIIANIALVFNLIVSKDILNKYTAMEMEMFTAITHFIIITILLLYQNTYLAISLYDVMLSIILAISFTITRVASLKIIQNTSIYRFSLYEYLKFAITIYVSYLIFNDIPTINMIIGSMITLTSLLL